MVYEEARLVGSADIAEGMKRMTFLAPGIARRARPGQFVMVSTEARGTLLARPLGVSGADPEDESLTLRFAVVGKGTSWLAERRNGDAVRMYGPLGHGFTTGAKDCVLIGGGTGLAPLFFLKEEIEREGGSALLLAGAKDRLCLMESDVLESGCVIATEDGSLGERGLVTGPLRRLTAGRRFDMAYACGPVPMLKAVKDACAQAGLPLEVSLETRMGCGVGACNGCTCDQAVKDGAWLKVCKDGPVFRAEEVLR
ncbi:MAG TPA: dihydroorotate dehydrogenase electron transfer subunit [Bacillota bacterium]|nr:dihydroorotate dehydrogenase electron transfer subunit [Bacillota bacterium]HPU95502.1 dihydroorotate dehydrogenase electron transfer subunit [Bacillota bacterium]